jgi:hypothetical protein
VDGQRAITLLPRSPHRTSSVRDDPLRSGINSAFAPRRPDCRMRIDLGSPPSDRRARRVGRAIGTTFVYRRGPAAHTDIEADRPSRCRADLTIDAHRVHPPTSATRSENRAQQSRGATCTAYSSAHRSPRWPGLSWPFGGTDGMPARSMWTGTISFGHIEHLPHLTARRAATFETAAEETRHGLRVSSVTGSATGDVGERGAVTPTRSPGLARSG